MPNTGGSHVDITASDKQARSTIAGFFKTVEAMAKKFNKQMGGYSPFSEWERESRKSTQTIGKNIENLPEHLKEFHKGLDETRLKLKQMDEAAVSFDEMRDAALKSAVAINKVTSVSSSGKSAIKTINELNHAVKETQMAVLGLNKEGTIKLTSAQTEGQLLAFRRQIDATRKDLEKLRDAGDFASYEAGMEVLERKLSEVDRAMRATARGGESYNRMLEEMGVHTANIANRAAIHMEAMKDKWIRNVELMQAKSTQSKKMMDILPEVSHIQRIDSFFLGIGNRLEQMAAKGTAAGIALKMLGPNASMKDLQDRVTLINQGLMRMQMVGIAAGIAVAGFTAAMFSAAKGPDIAQVFEERGKLLMEYHQQVQQRTQAIVDTWSLFEKAEIEKTKPETLMKNLQGQVNVMRNWASNIALLAKRGIDEGLLASLRKMGPEAAGQIQALTQMSAPELDRYVALWKEKHALARTAAETELEGLKQTTVQKIRELENSLTPLGIALQKSNAAWATALAPFVELWGKIAAKIIDASTALANFISKINEMNPSISTSAGMFLYLSTVLSLLLAPMAIGIGYASGMAASFTYIFTTIKPLALGLLRIAGIVSVVSGAIVIVVGTLMKMWSASEKLRNAVSSLGTVLQIGIQQQMQRIQPTINQLKAAIDRLLTSIFGSSKAGDIFKKMGDVLGNTVTWLTRNVLPYFMQIIGAVFSFVAKAINAVLPIINNLASIFSRNSDKISKVVNTTFTFVGKIIKFILSTAVDTVKFYLGAIGNIFNGTMKMINGIIDLFAGIFTGDFNRMWKGIKQIFFGALETIWGWIQLTFVGRILKILGVFARGAGGTISKFVKSMLGYFKNLFNSSRTIWNELVNTIRKFITNMINGTIKGIVNFKNDMLRHFRQLQRDGSNVFLGWLSTIVEAAIQLPARIGKGISGAAGAVKSGIQSLGRTMSGELAKAVNGVLSGVNSVMGKVGSKTKLTLWTPKGFKNPPRYADGTDGHKGGLAWLGDQPGEEFYFTPDGKVGLSPATPTLMDLPKGTSVLPHDQTKELLKTGLFPAYKKGAGDFLKDVWSYVSDPKDLFAKIVDKFSKKVPKFPAAMQGLATGAFTKIKDSVFDWFKDKIGGFGEGSGAGFGAGSKFKGSGAAMAKAAISKALSMLGKPMSLLNPLMTIAQRESGFNPNAINLWDINARRGDPSIGLFQVIGSTFKRWMYPGHGNRRNPLDSALAAIRYMDGRYGGVMGHPGIKSILRGGGYKPYAKGGFFLNGPEMGLFGEAGPEMALPLIGKHMQPYAQAVAVNLSNMLGGTTAASGLNVNINPAPVYLDREQIGEIIYDYVEDKKAVNHSIKSTFRGGKR